MADAEAQTPEAVADVRDRVAQAVVAAVPAAVLEAHAAHRQVELVVRHENLVGHDS